MIDIIGRDKIWKIIIETIFSSSGMSLEKINKWTFYLISCENQHLTNFFFNKVSLQNLSALVGLLLKNEKIEGTPITRWILVSFSWLIGNYNDS